MVDMKLVDNSVYKLLMEKFELGLFENPYGDVNRAEKLVGNLNFQAKGNLAFRKSIVLIRNESRILPLKPKTKVYFESYFQKKGVSPIHIYQNHENKYDVEFVKTPEEADAVLLWITPGSKSLFDADGSPLHLALSKNAVEVQHVHELIAKKPTVLVINYSNPWVIREIYDDKAKGNVKAVIATFGTTTDALLDIVTGKFNPTGKMPFTYPDFRKSRTKSKV